MSNPNSTRGKARINEIPNGESIADFSNYAAAVEFVNKLIAKDFPPTLISIIGDELKLVETVRARLGYGRIALSGAITGAWIGLLLGLLFGAGFTVEGSQVTGFQAASFMSAVVIGIGVGMMINIIRFAVSKNKRQFLSIPQTVAKRYSVVVPATEVITAKNLLGL